MYQRKVRILNDVGDIIHIQRAKQCSTHVTTHTWHSAEPLYLLNIPFLQGKGQITPTADMEIVVQCTCMSDPVKCNAYYGTKSQFN